MASHNKEFKEWINICMQANGGVAETEHSQTCDFTSYL